MKGKYKIIFSIFIFIFFMSFAYAGAVNDSLHLNVQAVDGSGNIITGIYKFEFNISTSGTCTDVVFTNYSTLTTNSQGIVSYYLENTNLNYSEQYWLCIYRDGIVQSNEKIARTPYAFRARNVTLSGIEADSNFNISNYNFTTTGTGFFNFLGSLISRITSLFVQNINFNGTINGSGAINTTANITADTFLGKWNGTANYYTKTEVDNNLTTINNSALHIGESNRTLLSCANITGTTSDLCAIQTGNVTGSGGDFSFSNFAASFVLNSTILNNTKNIGNLYNVTASMIANLSLSLTNLQAILNSSYAYRNANQTLVSCSNITGAAGDLCTVTGSGGDFSFSDFASSFVLNSTILNNTKNIGNLYNITASMIANLSISQSGTSGGNASWNQSFANTLYAPNTTAGIQWLINSTGVYIYAYNQTQPAIDYLINTYNTTWSSTFNQTYENYAYNVSLNYTQIVFSNYNSTWDESWFFQMISANVTGVNSTLNIQNLYNITASMIANLSISQSGGNASWNQSFANTLYAPNTTAGIQELINETGIYTSGVTGLSFFVNYTITTTTGNMTNGTLKGYSAGNNICNVEVASGSHMCSMDEILSTISNNISNQNFTATFRASEGAPGYLVSANDCEGWTSPSSSALGSIWVGSKSHANTYGAGGLVGCNAERAIACCK